MNNHILQLINETKMTVSKRFSAFLTNLTLTDSQRVDGIIKHTGVRKCLNKYYYGTESEYENSLLVGSWGKATAIRPPRDIDIMFVLPFSVYERYAKLASGRNKQSELLQEIKRVLNSTYPNTEMKGDGQVVMVPFSTYAVEVVPAFRLNNGQYLMCDTHDGGKYKTVDPIAEIESIISSDKQAIGNTRHLIKMLKKWQEYCNVPLKSFWLELLAVDFLRSWEYKGKSTVYYDWMVRDFMNYLVNKGKYGLGSLLVPGTYERIWLGEDWLSKAKSAQERAEKACSYESKEMPYSAGQEWQKLFGTYIPVG